jgi:hypothetical protein
LLKMHIRAAGQSLKAVADTSLFSTIGDAGAAALAGIDTSVAANAAPARTVIVLRIKRIPLLGGGLLASGNETGEPR